MAAVVDAPSRAGDWLRRYGFAELAGICSALFAAWLADTLGAPAVVVAYAGAVGENVGFYGTIIGREVAADRRLAAASGEIYGASRFLRTARELLLEFGPAELLDSLIIRPFAMALGVRYLGRDPGIIAGKLASDVSFYVPVIVTYELRKHARRRT